jgi:hypothetical protein
MVSTAGLAFVRGREREGEGGREDTKETATVRITAARK